MRCVVCNRRLGSMPMSTSGTLGYASHAPVQQPTAVSLVPQELPRPGRRAASLHERVVGTVQHGLRLGEGVDLISAGLLSHIVILEEPVAITVQRHLVLLLALQLPIQ